MPAHLFTDRISLSLIVGQVDWVYNKLCIFNAVASHVMNLLGALCGQQLRDIDDREPQPDADDAAVDESCDQKLHHDYWISPSQVKSCGTFPLSRVR